MPPDEKIAQVKRSVLSLLDQRKTERNKSLSVPYMPIKSLMQPLLKLSFGFNLNNP